MGFDLTSFLGSTIGDSIAKIVGVFKVSPEKQLEANTEITKLTMELQGKILDQVQGQLEVNKAEAASGDKFTSRWRPLCGYVCAAAMASNFVVAPFFTWGTQLLGSHVTYPMLDLSVMMPVLLGMLGLGFARSYDKANGSK